MALIVPTSGEVEVAKYYVNAAQPQDLVLRLYTNNVTPNNRSVAGDFVEAKAGGYAPIRLSGSGWTVKSGPPVEASYAQQAFSCDGSANIQNCYGYYVTREQSGEIAHAERFTNGPFSLQNDGDEIKITPRITFQQEK